MPKSKCTCVSQRGTLHDQSKVLGTSAAARCQATSNVIAAAALTTASASHAAGAAQRHIEHALRIYIDLKRLT